MAFRIFVVDDDPHYSRLVSYRLGKGGENEVQIFSSGEEALENLDQDPQLVMMDIMMPGIGGIETLRRVRERRPDLPVVMVSAQGVIETAVEAMKLGAYDYITKGQDDLVKLDVVLKNVRERVALERELESLRTEVVERYSIDGLIGQSPAMQDVYRLINKAIRADLTVAIQGESGTGKELVAKAIHYNSARKRGPFVDVNCAAIPRDLMESEFFGHEKGSFTGAHARKIGRFEQADGGTIFLDEIGEMDLELQAKLLRAIQNHEIQRVGGNETIKFDARVISATNQNMAELIREGRFREDLFYRLFQFPITLPPLRDRGTDILLLADHFLQAYISEHTEFRDVVFSPAARRTIVEYTWPGNVRELKSAVERAVLLAEDEEIQPSDLMLNATGGFSSWTHRRTSADLQPEAESADISESVEERGGDVRALDDIKRIAVTKAYHRAGGNVDKAAVELQIGRATMYRLLKKYGLMD